MTCAYVHAFLPGVLALPANRVDRGRHRHHACALNLPVSMGAVCMTTGVDDSGGQYVCGLYDNRGWLDEYGDASISKHINVKSICPKSQFQCMFPCIPFSGLFYRSNAGHMQKKSTRLIRMLWVVRKCVLMFARMFIRRRVFQLMGTSV